MKIFFLSLLLATGSIGFAANSMTKDRVSTSAGSRDYYLYVPTSKSATTPLPLVVMLHGCEQDAQGFAAITGMNDVAEKYGFAVLYPEQTNQNNILKCWNWFKPENQVRNGGELGIVMNMIEKTENEMPIDKAHIFVAGLSAGAAMASNLIALHSDLLAGAGIHSGLEFRAATTEAQAWQVQSMGSSQDIKKSASDALAAAGISGGGQRIPAVIVFHGSSDNVVNPINSNRILQQMTAINDLLDDSGANDSQSLNVITSLTGQVPNGYSYTTKFYGGKGSIHLEDVTVDQMSHAWSGAHQAGQFADPKGPDASEMIWLFLWNYSTKN